MADAEYTKPNRFWITRTKKLDEVKSLEKTIKKTLKSANLAEAIARNVDLINSFFDQDLALYTAGNVDICIDQHRFRYNTKISIPNCPELEARLWEIYDYFFDRCLIETEMGQGVRKDIPHDMEMKDNRFGYTRHIYNVYVSVGVFDAMVDNLTRIGERITSRTLPKEEYDYIMETPMRALKRQFLVEVSNHAYYAFEYLLL